MGRLGGMGALCSSDLETPAPERSGADTEKPNWTNGDSTDKATTPGQEEEWVNVTPPKEGNTQACDELTAASVDVNCQLNVNSDGTVKVSLPVEAHGQR